MNTVLVGDRSVFAIESSITQPYAALSQRALGYFVIYIKGAPYGVRSPTATLLACSFDAVQRRIARRGTHCSALGSEGDAPAIVDAVRAVMYDEDRQDEVFFGHGADQLKDGLIANEIVWAPDGDAAFDDGGHVLQFDVGKFVRLIAFKNCAAPEQVPSTVADVMLGADDYYDLLDSWRRQFEAGWLSALRRSTGH